MTLQSALMNGTHLNRSFGIPKQAVRGKVTLTQEEMAGCLNGSPEDRWKAIKAVLMFKGVPAENLQGNASILCTENEDGSLTLEFK